SARERVLNDEIAELEAQIKRLDSRVQREQSHPRLRSTALPHGETLSHPAAPTGPASQPAVQEPIFEEVDLNPLKVQAESPATPEHFNELGIRKYDLPALVRRVRGHFKGPSTTNPRLVSYL